MSATDPRHEALARLNFSTFTLTATGILLLPYVHQSLIAACLAGFAMIRATFAERESNIMIMAILTDAVHDPERFVGDHLKRVAENVRMAFASRIDNIMRWRSAAAGWRMLLLFVMFVPGPILPVLLLLVAALVIVESALYASCKREYAKVQESLSIPGRSVEVQV